MPKKNIKGELKKYKKKPTETKQQPRGRPPAIPTKEVVNGNLLPIEKNNNNNNDEEIIIESTPPPIITKETNTIPKIPNRTHEFLDAGGSWAMLELQYKREKMDGVIAQEEERIRNVTDPNTLISNYQRTIYLNCGHKVTSCINNIKLDSFYYCFECVLFKKISEVVY